MTNASRIALLAMGVSLAACSDNTMGPSGPEPQARSDNHAGGSTLHLASADTVKFSITIDPSSESTFDLGSGNTLTFPAGSLCDVSSSYGKKEWDAPCATATEPLTVNVMAWIDAKGHARVDFDKHVRFVPSDDPSQWVVITFADMQAALDPEFAILYCPNVHGSCTDESKKDPTLRVMRDPLSGKITRRIKHFSGYNVAAGRDAESDDAFGEEMFALWSIGNTDATRESGYILASG